MHDKYCMKNSSTSMENSNTNNILPGCSIPSSNIVAAAQPYGKVTIQHSRREAGPVSSLWDAGDDLEQDQSDSTHRWDAGDVWEAGDTLEQDQPDSYPTHTHGC